MKKKYLVLVMLICCFFIIATAYVKKAAKDFLALAFSEKLSYEGLSFSLPLKITVKNITWKVSDDSQIRAASLSLRLDLFKSAYHFAPWIHWKLENTEIKGHLMRITGSTLLRPEWQTIIKIQEKNFSSYLNAHGKLSDNKIKGSLFGKITLNNLPKALDTCGVSSHFEFKGGELKITSFFLQHKALQVEASGFATQDTHFFGGKFTSPDLAVISSAKGALEGSFFIEDGDIVAAASSPSLTVLNKEIPSLMLIAQFQKGKNGYFNMASTYPFHISSRLIFESGNLTFPDIKIESEENKISGSAVLSEQLTILNLSLDMPKYLQEASFDLHKGKNAVFSFRAKKISYGGYVFEHAALEGDSDDKGHRIASFRGEYEKLPVYLKNEALLIKANHKILLEPSIIMIGKEGEVICSGSLENGLFQGNLIGKNLALKLSKADLRTAFDFHVEGPLERLLGRGSLKAHGFLREENKEIPVNLDIEAGLKKTGFQLIGKGFFLSPLDFSLDIPCRLSIYPFAITIDKNAPLKGSFDLHADLTPLSDIFDPGMILQAEIDTHMQLAGTFSNPELHGSLKFQNGFFEDEISGFSFSHLKGEIFAKKNRLEIASLSGVFGNEGNVTGNGELQLSLRDDFPFKINLKLHQTDGFSSDVVHNLLSGDLILEGSREALWLRGELTAGEMEVVIPDESEDDMDTVDITYLGEEKESSEAESALSLPFSYEIKVNIPRTLVIRDNKLFSRWRGDLFLIGGRSNSGLYGDLKVVEGEYVINGKRFEIKQGSVTLRGDLERKTSLFVTADLEMPKLTAHVTVKGPLQKPRLSFRSTPPKSQREILSYVLFGKGISDISFAEGEELSESLIELNQSGSKGPDVLTQIQNRIGIDQIDISRDEATESAVSLRIGKYLSRGVFVWLNRGINDNSNRVAIEARLIRNFLLQAEIGDGENSDNEISIKWKMDY